MLIRSGGQQATAPSSATTQEPQTTLSGSSRLPVGPIWMSVFISGQTPQS